MGRGDERNPGHMTKMAATPIYHNGITIFTVKTFQKSFSPEPAGQFS